MIAVKITVQKKKLPSVDKDRLLRTIAESMLGNMRHRIHTEGIDSSGNAIGDYSDPYLKHRIKKGKGNDSKVIISFTRQMQNDMQVVETPTGYGIGYSNQINADKVIWVESTYDKKIFAATQEEKKEIQKLASAYIAGLFGNKQLQL